MSTFWNDVTTAALSRIKQTPLALMYCFQRLQHLIRGGMSTLLEYVELILNERSMDFLRNRITWDVVCWAFGLKHKGDQLCIVEIPFKDVNSCLAAIERHCKVNCKLKLEYDTSSNKEEVLSLFQYNAVGQHFRVPILESAWKALPNSTTMTVIDGDNDNSPNLHQLWNRKVPFKREGIVVATYNQPKRIDPGATHSLPFIICSEDAEKYRTQTLVEARPTCRAIINSMCKHIVSDSSNRISMESTAVVKSPFKFSCAVDSFEIKDVNENFIQAIFYKQKTFNTGRTALRFRLIDDSELLPFTCGHDIRNYLEETMICDLMFCSLTDIESRSTALSGPVLLTDDAFLTLRLIVEKLWHLGSEQEKKLAHLVLIEIQEQRKTSPVMILDVKGYYMYGGLPLIKLRFMEHDRNSAAIKTIKDTTTVYVKDRGCLELIKKMLLTNSLRISQERPTESVNLTASSSQSINTFLQMVFVRDCGKVMASRLDYPLNTELVKNYIKRIYSASIRQNFVPRMKSKEMLEKQMEELLSSFSAIAPQFPTGDQKSDSVMTNNSSNMPLKQQTSCSKCNKSTTDLKRCARCMSVAYCSKDCQVKDWSQHKRKCSSALLKADGGSVIKKGNESGLSIKAERTNGSSMESKIQNRPTNDLCIKGASASKKIVNDPLTKAKIESSSSASPNSESTFSIRPKSNDNSEDDSALKPKTEYCTSNSKNPDCGASAKTEDGDHSFELETNDAISYLESAFADSAKAYNSSMQSKFHANHSEKKKNEVGSSIKAENPSQSHLAEIKSKDVYDATADNSVGPRSGELCTSCRLENVNMKECAKCKSAAYCSRECQRADWKRHRSECQTQQHPSTVPLMSCCDSCGVLGTEMKKCCQCKNASYCGPECQRRDWKNHKITCRRP